MRNALRASIVVLAGCASSPTTRPDEPLIDAQRPGAPAEAGPTGPDAAAAQPPQSPGAALPPGQIARGDYDRVLAASPALFLAHVETEPSFELSPKGRRFIGWRLNALFPGDPRFAGAALRPGDVITRVNGGSVERPEQFMDAWQAARGRSDLRIDILRDGHPRTLRWDVVGR